MPVGPSIVRRPASVVGRFRRRVDAAGAVGVVVQVALVQLEGLRRRRDDESVVRLVCQKKTVAAS